MVTSRDASDKGFGVVTLVLTGMAAIFALAFAATASAAVTAATDAGAVASTITDAQPGLQTGASFTVNGPLAQCGNGQDDDNNGAVDANDPGCVNASDNSEEPGFGSGGDEGVPQCQNGFDDDDDGNRDTADTGCASATDANEGAPGAQTPGCSDGLDNDDDTDIDAADDDCSGPNDNSEDFEEECGNGLDDDGDGQTDTADGGCSFSYDDDESSNNGVGASASKQAGISDTALTGFPTSGGSFGVLTSGNAELADDPNSDGGSGEDTGGQAYQDAFDPVTLKIEINVPEGANCVGFEFRFLSEEFPEFVNAGFNDAFVAQLDNLRTSTEQPGQCKSLALEPFEGSTGVWFANPGDPFNLAPDLSALVFQATCNLPPGNELACNPSFSFAFTPGAGAAKSRAHARGETATPLAAGSASIPSGQTQQVSLATTPAGKAAVQAAIDRPAKLLKKAKKLKKKAKKADGKKKKKLLKKAKKLKKQAKALNAAPVGTISGTVTNPANGATQAIAFALPRE